MKKVLLLAVAILSVFALSGLRVYAADTLTIDLGAQNNSGQNGTATLTDMGDGTTRVVVNISGGSDTAQPAHIHAGSCANLDPKPKWPLTSLVNGTSDTIVPVPLIEIANGTNAINVHKSGAEASVYVSCGDITALAVTTGMPQTGASPLLIQTLALVALALIVTAFGWRMRRRA
jgi:hypothetical protein